MNALDTEAIYQQKRLNRKSKSLLRRIKVSLLAPWNWASKPSCFMCGLADSKTNTSPRCSDIEYSEGYAEGVMVERRRNPEFNKEISR